VSNAAEYGLDARNAMDELDGCDAKKLTVADDVAANALTTVHGLYLMKFDAAKDGSKLPPTLPLSLSAMSPRYMQDLLVQMRPRLSATLPAAFPHKVCADHIGLKLMLGNSTVMVKDLGLAAEINSVSSGFGACWAPLATACPCDRVKISRSDGYRPLKLSSVCDCIIEVDGESSRHDHPRE
jgi:hypothetical protein